MSKDRKTSDSENLKDKNLPEQEGKQVKSVSEQKRQKDRKTTGQENLQKRKKSDRDKHQNGKASEEVKQQDRKTFEQANMQDGNAFPKHQPDKKICLVMIVKNEAEIIQRCLDSAKPVIDCISICDTGSEDETPDLIKKWGEDHKIPTTVHYEAFRNFGYNRSLAVSLAQETYPESDYLLVLDADMILEETANFDKSSLSEAQYLTLQYDGQIKFWLTRLLKASLPWKSVGVTHEYWDLDQSQLEADQVHFPFHSTGKLDHLVVNDIADGGSRRDKFERDKRLLHEGIEDPKTPQDLRTRYLFYLGQTYMCLGEHQEAIKWYQERVKAGGWEEEIFYSLLQIGNSYEGLAEFCSEKRGEAALNSEEDPSEAQRYMESLTEHEIRFRALAIYYYQEAWNTRPTRAEPLYQLSKLHRLKGQHRLGLMYALRGKELPFPKEDLLFVDYHVYDYLFDYEISICAYYIDQQFELGREAQKKLQQRLGDLPTHIAEAVKNNAQFYST